MSNIEIRFNGGSECQKIFIPASTGKKRIHLVFTKSKERVTAEIDTLIVDNKICFQCKHCGNRYETRQSALNHIRMIHSDKRDHQCNFCGKCFVRPSLLSAHIKVHLEKPHKCSLCRRRFDSEEKLQIHFKGQHEGRIRRYQCGNCERTFLTMQHLKEHVLSHSKENNFKCHICGRSFNQAERLKLHTQRVHENTQVYKCTECPKELKSKAVLKLHLKRIHKIGVEDPEKKDKKPEKTVSLFKERQTEFICYVCGRIFHKKEFLTNHLRIHTGEKPFKCDLCNMTFRQKGHLQRHQKKHTGEKNFLCSFCHKKFSRHEHLKVHEKTHLPVELREVSLSTCQVCNQSFRTRCLKKHMKTHEAKFFQCQDCGGSFANEISFKNHVIDGHHFIGPVKTCPICYKEFSRPSHVKRHMINIHSSKPHRCSICGEAFEKEIDCQNHVVKDHGLLGRIKKKTVRQQKKKEKEPETDSEDDEDDEDEDIEEEVEEEVVEEGTDNSIDVLDLLY